MLRVLFLTPEVVPYSKTGGLGDISAAMPRALAQLGIDVRVVTPRYGFIDRERHGIIPVNSLPETAVTLGGRRLTMSFTSPAVSPGGARVYFVENSALYDRPGVYVDPFTGRDYIDNDYRYVLLNHGAIRLCELLGWTPDIIHGHDWQTGLAPLYLHEARAGGRMAGVRSLFTIHNMAYQGLFSGDTARRTGSGETFYYPGGPLEFYGHVSFLKAGLEFSDMLNTVSPTYAREIQSGYEFGYGLEGVLRSRSNHLKGILNGIDEDVWNPATDPHVYQTYTMDSLERKTANKQALCESVGFRFESGTLLIGMISRIVQQKGFEILLPVLQEILNLPACMIVLGSGDPHFEHVFHEFARLYPERFRITVGYDEKLAHRIEAGADVFLMPSKFEPCGLNQMMSMRYGTVPIVRATGGLADTVIDADYDSNRGTGFTFTDFSSDELMRAVQRARSAWQNQNRWRQIQRNDMTRDFSWEQSARQYVDLYQTCLDNPPRERL